ncbi:MAG TPA: antibiotic biosynthesis monooxygenase, partial [Streptosporangiaceae bacterium]
GSLMARCFRAPRGDLVAWSVALLGLLISLGAQALGGALGFNEVSFRAMEIGAQLIAPLALVMGLAEANGTSLITRFLSRLFLPCIGLVGLVIMGSDPLGSTSFSKSWPDPSTYYQVIPNKLVLGIGGGMAVIALIAVIVAAARSGRGGPWRALLLPVFAATVAVWLLALPAVSPELGDLPLSSLFAIFCLLAAGLTWLAGVRAEKVPLAGLRGGRADSAADDGYDQAGYGDSGNQEAIGAPGDYQGSGYADAEDSWAGQSGWPDRTGDFEAYNDGGMGVYRGAGLYRDEPPRSQNGAADYPADVLPAAATGDYDSRQIEHGGGYGQDDLPPGPGAGGRGDPQGAGQADRDQLFGQIAIYTLMEDRVHEFDRLTERVVAQVRSSEPGTLVFIVHAVPSAPMQRILYEVYRDRAASDWHNQQPYVAEFEAERRPYVLATNVIELGLQQAKVSPFPSIADLFGEPGYDTSGFERPDFTREYGSSTGSNGTGR